MPEAPTERPDLSLGRADGMAIHVATRPVHAEGAGSKRTDSPTNPGRSLILAAEKPRTRSLRSYRHGKNWPNPATKSGREAIDSQ